MKFPPRFLDGNCPYRYGQKYCQYNIYWAIDLSFFHPEPIGKTACADQVFNTNEGCGSGCKCLSLNYMRLASTLALEVVEQNFFKWIKGAFIAILYRVGGCDILTGTRRKTNV